MAGQFELPEGWRDISNPPMEEPSADARQFARNLRDAYTALRAENFTEPQALMILGYAMAAASQNGDDDE